MKDTNFDLEFEIYYLDLVNFKQKQAYIIQENINKSRLSEFMKFNSFCIIQFDENDTKHRYPQIQVLDKFNRTKCNCMMFDLSYNSKNNGIYDKCFIFQTFGKSDNYYGFLLYNSLTGKTSTKFLIDPEYDNLCTKLTQTFNIMAVNCIYNYYNEKLDCIKGRNGKKLINCPSIIEYNKMIDDYHKRLNIQTIWK